MANDDWREVNVAELPTVIREAYDAAKAIYREYKEAKGIFEQAMQAHVADSMPQGQELKFGYNFGKLSVAVGPKREAKRGKVQAQGSLNDWLTTQRIEGHRN